jgi:hypothetical protein
MLYEVQLDFGPMSKKKSIFLFEAEQKSMGTKKGWMMDRTNVYEAALRAPRHAIF